MGLAQLVGGEVRRPAGPRRSPAQLVEFSAQVQNNTRTRETCKNSPVLRAKTAFPRLGDPDIASKKPKTPVAAFVNKQELPATLCAVLVPFSEESEIPTLKHLKSTDPNQIAIEVSFNNGRTDRIAIAAKDTDLSAGTHKGKGVALCARVKKTGATLDIVKQKPLAYE